MTKPFAFAYLYALSGAFAVVLVVSAAFGQIANFLIYGSGLLAVTTAILGICGQEYNSGKQANHG